MDKFQISFGLVSRVTIGKVFVIKERKTLTFITINYKKSIQIKKIILGG